MDPRADFPWSWRHLTSSTLVRTGRGVLHTVIVNQGGKAGVVVIFDGVAIIATIAADFDQPRTLLYDLEFHTNLNFVIVGVWDITVTYK